MSYELVEKMPEVFNNDSIGHISNHDIIPREETIVFKFYKYGNSITKKFGVVHKEEIYRLIDEGKDINLNYCYIENFSLREYRASRGMKPNQSVSIKKITAVSSFFTAQTTIDFKGVKIIEGNVNFTSATFGDGYVSFTDADFGKGDVSFGFTTFGNGKASFKRTTFGKGSLRFDHAIFGKGDVDFYGAKFGKSGVDFRRTEFGKGNVNFKNTLFGEGNVSFDNVIFEEGYVNFNKSAFQEANASFQGVVASDTNITFIESTFRKYMDMRFKSCKKITFSNCKIEKVIDMNWSRTFGSNVRALDLHGTINLGQIKINWKKDKVKEMIYSKFNLTNYEQKAEQFRMLKENFRNIGQYDDEDKAYLELKRCERKSRHKSEDIEFPSCKIKSSSMTNYIICNVLQKDLKKEYKCIKVTLNGIFWIARFLEGSLRFYVYLLRRIYRLILNPFKWFILDFTGHYGTNPWRVLFTMFLVICLFGSLYAFNQDMEFTHFNKEYDSIAIHFANDTLSLEIPTMKTFKTSIYYSGITFLTIGYGDIQPSNFPTQITSVIEGFIGLFLMSYFTVAFVRKMLR